MRSLKCIVAIAGCCVTIASLGATVVVSTDLTGVIDDSAVIIRGRVTDLRAINDRQVGVTTIATVSVTSVLKGQANDTVWARVPGGQIGRDKYTMVGAPVLQLGEDAVWFLKRGSGDAWWPVGLSMGVYPVWLNAQTGVATVSPPLVAGRTADAGQQVVRGDTRRQSMPATEFESLVRVLIASQAQGAGK